MLSCGRLFATPWSVACQVPLSMEFSRQEYGSGLPFPSPGESTNLLLSNIWAIIYSWSMKYFLKSTNCCLVTQSFPTLCHRMGREAHQASLSFTISQSLLKFMSTESVTLHNGLILCCPLLLPSIFPRIRVLSNEWVHQVAKVLELQLQAQSFQWKFGIDWFDLLAVQGTLESLL